MRFENQPESSHVEDRRGERRRVMPGFGVGRLRGGGGLGLGGLLLLLALAWFTGGAQGVVDLLTGGSGAVAARSNESGPVRDSADEREVAQFVSQVLATTETCWRDLFGAYYGSEYEPPHLVLFRDSVTSACGAAQASVGPFYCPSDRRIYLDLGFLEQMQAELGAEGDFAQAYVVAHEVGHHVQNLIGSSRKVEALHGRVASDEYNRASVRLELQADYFAGVWAHYVQHRLQGKAHLEIGDFEEAIRAARAVGDDTLQKRATGRVMPEKFTHGTAAQRAHWFRLGWETGDPRARDPFTEEK